MKKGVTEEFPFGENTLVFKVMGKMFALTNIELFDGVNLKVDPEEGAALRDEYSFVVPAYHMNKKHWITVDTKQAVPDRLLKKWVDDSYALVVEGLSKSQRLGLDML
jgi:predicted DNA-binding protein (MmcQ/YjbR family)